MICITPKDVGGKYVEPRPLYASTAFAWEIYGSDKKVGSAELKLRNFVSRTMPGYATLLEPRYPVGDLLKDNCYNADVVYITALWLYSSLVSSERFPCGTRQWPPETSSATSSSATSCTETPLAGPLAGASAAPADWLEVP